MQTRKAAYYHSNAAQIIGDIQDPLNILLDAVLESSYDGIYITDGSANTIRVNTSYEIISGLKRSEVIGKNMRYLVASGLISKSGTLLALEKRQSATLEQKFKTGKQAVVTSTPTFDDLKQMLMEIERDYIDTAYNMYRNVRKAAKSLSMDAATYVRKRRKYGSSGAYAVKS